jgi:hypothetical protein
MTDEPDRQTADNGDDGRTAQGQFAEGNPGGPGRPKGKPNRVNAVLRDDIMDAYEQRGGVQWLANIKDRDFAGLLAKVLPKDAAPTPEKPLPPFILHVGAPPIDFAGPPVVPKELKNQVLTPQLPPPPTKPG